jgi:hypothetical protein
MEAPDSGTGRIAMSQSNQLPAPEAAWDGADGRKAGGGTVRLGKPRLSRSGPLEGRLFAVTLDFAHVLILR